MPTITQRYLGTGVKKCVDKFMDDSWQPDNNNKIQMFGCLVRGLSFLFEIYMFQCPNKKLH